MPEAISRLQQQITELWSNLDKSQKTRIYITSAILVVAIAAGIFFLTRTNYVPVVSNADPKEITEMTKVLEEKKIPFRLSDDQKGIIVDSKDRNKAQVALAQEGLPKGGVAFEDAFNLIKINTTESDKKKLWENYKKSTLISKLKMLDNVKDADVDLALPEQSPFVLSEKDEKRPTAYVRVTPKDELTEKQVQGIVMMVSRSVEGLDPKDITVVDNNANILNNSGDSLSADANTQEEMRIKKARELEKRVYNLFNGQFDNFDSIRVVANPVLDFNKVKSQTNDVQNPTGMEDGAVVTSDKTSEKLQNANNGAVPGMDTNPGNANSPSYQIGNNGNSTYDKKSEKLTKDYKRILTEEEKALGVMDPDKSSMTVTLWYGKRATDEAKLSPDFINQLKADVSTATGVPAAKISVNKYKLAPPEQPQNKTIDNIRQLINDYGIFALLLLLVIGLMIALIPKRKKESAMEPAVAQVAAANGPRFIVPEATDEMIPEIDMEERSEVKKQIEKFVKQKPDAVAQLLRNWLADDWD